MRHQGRQDTTETVSHVQINEMAASPHKLPSNTCRRNPRATYQKRCSCQWNKPMQDLHRWIVHRQQLSFRKDPRIARPSRTDCHSWSSNHRRLRPMEATTSHQCALRPRQQRECYICLPYGVPGTHTCTCLKRQRTKLSRNIHRLRKRLQADQAADANPSIVTCTPYTHSATSYSSRAKPRAAHSLTQRTYNT